MARLIKGSSLKSVNFGTYIVDKYLDSGTQAAVYLVSSGGKNLALKWYSGKNAALVRHFLGLMKNIPKDNNGQADKRFVWPQDIIDSEDGFGYTMDFVETNKYITLHELTYHLYIKEENYIPGGILCDICINIAEAFKTLHSAGYCYKDISSNNIVFNIKTGDVLIFDVDNVVVSGEIGEIQGTPKFMAPEVILGKTHPDSQSDRFSLASYFFHLLVGHYPFEGKLRDDYVEKNGPLGEKAFQAIYGTNPVFCFHPFDTSNNLNSADYIKIVERWENTIPQELKQKFIKTFVKGLPFNMRTERATNSDWVKLFTKFKQNIIICSCGKWYFPGTLKCIKCQKVLTTASASAKIYVKEKGANNQRGVTLAAKSIIKGEDISKIISNYAQLAEVVVNPKTGELGLKNLSTLEWYYRDVTDKNLLTVPQSKIVTLKKGRIIAFSRGEVQVTVE
jgi:eukaryotic-like serine/threonine-protein kinase